MWRNERRLFVTLCAVETVGVSDKRGCRSIGSSGKRKGKSCRRLRERYNGVVEDVYVGVSRRHRRAGLLGSTTSRSQRDRVLGATPPVSGDRRRRDGAPLLLLQQPAQALSQGRAGEGPADPPSRRGSSQASAGLSASVSRHARSSCQVPRALAASTCLAQRQHSALSSRRRDKRCRAAAAAAGC